MRVSEKEDREKNRRGETEKGHLRFVGAPDKSLFTDSVGSAGKLGRINLAGSSAIW